VVPFLAGAEISVAVKHEEFELFKELKSFIEQQYPNNHDNIYKLIRQISDDKMIFKVSLSELRNFCAHPKDLLNDKIDAIITKDQYYKVKSFLFSPPTQLLIQLLNKDGSF
jgi:abortive infection bacteriophage resistance protein